MKRIQRRRTKGWRMPEGAVYVGRPSRWGNPFHPYWLWSRAAAAALGLRADDDGARRAVITLYRWWMTGTAPVPEGRASGYRVEFTEGRDGGTCWLEGYAPVDLRPRPDIAPLRGRDLVCWCPLDQPCHADVLLELANA